jgi:uncharacterized protein (TIGR03000 family)
MSRRPVSFLTTAALAVAALIMAANRALAQRGGHGGGGHGGGFHGGGFGSGFRGGFRDGFRGGFHDGFRGGFRDGFGRGFRGGVGGRFFPGYYGYGLGFGGGFYGYGSGPSSAYGSSGYGYSPSYANASSGYTPNSSGYSNAVVSGYYPPAADAARSAVDPAGYGTDLGDNTAHIQMKVRADAEVWFDGVKTSQSGAMREFVSPPLDPAKKFGYQVRARWTDNGITVEQTRKVNVYANAWTAIDFTRPELELLPAPTTR